MIRVQLQIKDTVDPGGEACFETDVTFSDPEGDSGNSLGALIGYAIIAAEPCLCRAPDVLEGIKDVLLEHVASIKNSSYEEVMKGMES